MKRFASWAKLLLVVFGIWSGLSSDLALAADLFVSIAGPFTTFPHHASSIDEFTPNGTQSTFVASGLDLANGLAFDSNGNLYEADTISGNIYKFTPSGGRSTFASGLGEPHGLAFDSSGNLFVTNLNSGTGIYKLTFKRDAIYVRQWAKPSRKRGIRPQW